MRISFFFLNKGGWICRFSLLTSLFQDQIRVSKKTIDQEKPQLGLIDRWYHTACFVTRREELAFKPEYIASQLKGFGTLRAEDKEELLKRLPAIKTDG